MQILLKKLVESMDLEAIPAHSGSVALNYFQSPEKHKDIALTLLDLGLPDISGLEILGQIHKLSPNMKVCCVTGNSNLGDVKKAARYGIKGYIIKPIKPEELKAKINSILEP